MIFILDVIHSTRQRYVTCTAQPSCSLKTLHFTLALNLPPQTLSLEKMVTSLSMGSLTKTVSPSPEIVIPLAPRNLREKLGERTLITSLLIELTSALWLEYKSPLLRPIWSKSQNNRDKSKNEISFLTYSVKQLFVWYQILTLLLEVGDPGNITIEHLLVLAQASTWTC